MQALSREEVRNDLLRILREIREGWEFPDNITEETGIFLELGFESIDAVALGPCLEEHYDQGFPFAEVLTEAQEQQLTDISVGRLIKFLMSNMNGARNRSTL